MFRALWSKPRKPIIQIPVVYAIGWWSYQHSLTIENFSVELIESNLGLMNSKTLAAYTISCLLKYDSGHEPFVKNIHVAEEVLQAPQMEKGITPKAILKIMPVVAVKVNKNYKGDSIAFKIHNEHTIQSMGWGLNSVQFECSDFRKELTLQQSK